MIKAVATRLLAHTGLVGIMVAGAASGLHAQETGNPSGAQKPDDNVILVTAQKRSQDVLDVGISISVVDAEAIAARRIESATDIVAFTPNVSVKENVPGLVPVITIRGVGLNDFSATNNPSAGVYVDEVSLSSLALMNFDLFDLERMEVLKGPQGTLYGRNTTAGALNVVSARPDTSAIRARVSASLANYNTKDFEAMINLPLSDTAALRLAGKAIIQDEGFYFNEATGRDIGRREVFLGRAQLLLAPTDTVEALFKAEIQRGRSEIGQPEFFGLAPPVPPEPGLVCPGSPRCTDFFGFRDVDGDPFRGSWSVDPTYDVNQLNLTARISAVTSTSTACGASMLMPPRCDRPISSPPTMSSSSRRSCASRARPTLSTGWSVGSIPGTACNRRMMATCAICSIPRPSPSPIRRPKPQPPSLTANGA
jgi:iron complex outermembrane receptor protein